jgi:AcrR family transcriptional regulator
LDVACQVFGEKGYRDATHADICALAEVNIAAINYHFGSKDALYRAAWQYAFHSVEAMYPFDEGITPDSTPAQKLRAVLLALLRRQTDDERLRHFHAIHMAEIFNSSGIADDLAEAELKRHRDYTQAILREVLGPKATQPDVELCELGVIGPVFMAFPPHRGAHEHPIWPWTADNIESLADGIVTFAMAGIAAIRDEIACRDGSVEAS